MHLINGPAFLLGDNINTDLIVPPKFVGESNLVIMASHAFEAIRPELPSLLKNGGVLVCGENFGCGSSREQATEVIKQLGITCVIAKSFARIFFRNAINNGLLVLQCARLHSQVVEGDLLRISPDKGEIQLSGGSIVHFDRLPDSLMAMVREGGLVNYWKKVNNQGHA